MIVQAIMKRELLLASRQRGRWLGPLMFYLITATFFPLGLPSEFSQLNIVAPGMIWIAVLLSTMLSMDHLFIEDKETGVLEQWLISGVHLPTLVLIKSFAHWCVYLLPVLLITPIIAYAYQLQQGDLGILWISLLLGTPIMSLFGAMCASLTLTIKQSGFILALMMLPLLCPLIILGANCTTSYMLGIFPSGQLALLGAMLIVSMMSIPYAISFALKAGVS